MQISVFQKKIKFLAAVHLAGYPAFSITRYRSPMCHIRPDVGYKKAGYPVQHSLVSTIFNDFLISLNVTFPPLEGGIRPMGGLRAFHNDDMSTQRRVILPL